MQAGHHLLGAQSCHLKTDNPGGKVLSHWRMEGNMIHLSQALLELAIEGVNPSRNPRLPNGLMEPKGLPKRPAVLKGMKAPWRHHRAQWSSRRRDPLQPAPVGLSTKRRNHNM